VDWETVDWERVDELNRVGGSRHDHVGVLRGPPPLDPMVDAAARPVTGRKVDEVRRLLELLAGGLLSEEEFDSQMVKIYGTAARG
jgi:hypothetical protein